MTKKEERKRMLPQEPTKPVTKISDLTMLLYGPSKIGKSTFCSKAEKAIFLATEPGLNHLEVYQAPIKNWDDFLWACVDINEGKHDFKTIAIDTVDNLHKMCEHHVCKKHKIEHPSDLGYGKGYAFVNDEFARAINWLALSPYGLILVSHSTEKEIETNAGKRTRIVPTVPAGCRKFLTGLVDLILYCDIIGNRPEDDETGNTRVIRTKPSQNYEAGDRTGQLPDTLPLDFEVLEAALIGGDFGEKDPGPPDSDDNNHVPGFDDLKALAAEIWEKKTAKELNKAIEAAGFNPAKMTDGELSTMIDILEGIKQKIKDEKKHS